MFGLRAVESEDVEDLYELSNLVSFINLPPDKELIKKKINSSIQAFQSPNPDKSKNYYIFVLEDLDEKKVIGVSLIHGQHGTDEEPHYFLKVGTEKKYSETISTGFIHGTLKLDYEPNGYTEIGGLVIHPEYRGNPQKLGKQLTLVRFLYMATNKDQFTKKIHVELMPPLDKDGNSPLWEAIGRRFMNMDYSDADVLSRSNKEFILSLFPSEPVYQTLLPVEARDAIGKVGNETKPVKKMLEDIGFKYMMEVDPFDGGPHYRADLEDLKPVKNLIIGDLCFVEELNEPKRILINITTNNLFKAISFFADVEQVEDKKIIKILKENSAYFPNELKQVSAIYL